MAVTMQDIARGLNVSVVAISKVLRNTGNISADTRNRVQRRAKQLYYWSNWIAASLVYAPNLYDWLRLRLHALLHDS